jgi:hypothetical protein
VAALFYREERDGDFLNACEQVRREEPSQPAYRTASKAAYRAAKSFYVKRCEYAKIIRTGYSGMPKNPAKKEMYAELRRRAEKVIAENPGMPIREVAKILSEQESPRFYISEKTAQKLYYSLLKRKRP